MKLQTTWVNIKLKKKSITEYYSKIQIFLFKRSPFDHNDYRNVIIAEQR